LLDQSMIINLRNGKFISVLWQERYRS